jgi:hypothetical protein
MNPLLSLSIFGSGGGGKLKSSSLWYAFLESVLSVLFVWSVPNVLHSHIAGSLGEKMKCGQVVLLHVWEISISNLSLETSYSD